MAWTTAWNSCVSFVAVSFDLIKLFSTSPLHGSCVSFVAVTHRLFSLQCLHHNTTTALLAHEEVDAVEQFCFHQTHPSPHDPTRSRRHSSQLTTHEIELQHNDFFYIFYYYFFYFLYFLFFNFLKEINHIKTYVCLLDPRPFHTFFVEKKKNNVTRKIMKQKHFCFSATTATPLLPVSINQCQQHT